jgi:Cu2+-containing amine oxidase
LYTFNPGHNSEPDYAWKRAIYSAFLLITLFVLTTSAQTQNAKHPLDGLTAPEYWAVYETLKASGKTDAKTPFPLIQFKEPPKEEVLAWKPGQAMRREALVIMKQGPQTFEVVVDASGKKLISWNEIKGVQPNLVEDEEHEIDEPVKENIDVQAALRRRGITDYATVQCGGYGTGYFATPDLRSETDRFGAAIELRGLRGHSTAENLVRRVCPFRHSRKLYDNTSAFWPDS